MKSPPRAPASSGIPLPHSLMPSSLKADTRCRDNDLPRVSTQTPKCTPTHTPVHSPLLNPRGSSIPAPCTQVLQRDPQQKSLFKRAGAIPAPQVSRSAYSSPLTQRRVPPPHSKDTMDLGKLGSHHSPLPFPRDGNHNRSTITNKNQISGTSNLRSSLQYRRGNNTNTVCHTVSETTPKGEEKALEHHPAQAAMLNNSNLRPSHAETHYRNTIRGHSDSNSQSDEEMGTPEDNSPASSPGLLPLPPIVFTMPVMPKVAVDMPDQSWDREADSAETHTPRVNMATVAPFSYRQVMHTHTHTHTLFWSSADC